MSIKDISGFQKTLGNADASGWSRGVDNNSKGGFDIETGMGGLDGTKETGGAQSFGDMLSESIGRVNSMQNEANVAMEKLASGESQNLHETLLAVEKADIAFRTLNQVRSKVIDAYKEIMKMQI